MLINSLFFISKHTFTLILPVTFLLLGIILLFTKIRSEKFYSTSVLTILSIGFVNSIFLLFSKIVLSDRYFNEDLSSIFLISHSEFKITTIGLIIGALSYLLTIVTAKFSKQYLHKEIGFPRFYLLLLLFCYGMIISANSQTFQGIYIGWEFVGLTSFLLISFFYQREKSVHRGLRIYAWYKFADFFLLIGIATSLTTINSANFTLFSEICLCIAILIKSAQLPFSYWLPWALEGPSPSSAVFYGGLGIHLGALALLNYTFEHQLSSISVVMLLFSSLTTLLLSRITQKSQADAKSLIVYGVISQVSIIIIEIIFGFRNLALLHIVGHALLRTYQILRVGGIIHDHPVETWRSFIKKNRLSIVDKASFKKLKNQLFYESSKEVHFVHLPIILIEKLANKISHLLRFKNQKNIYSSNEIVFFFISFIAIASLALGILGIFKLNYFIYLGYLFIVFCFYFIFSTPGIKELPRSLLLFHLGLVVIQLANNIPHNTKHFVIDEAISLTIAFSGILLAKSILQKRFGINYVGHHSGLIAVCPEAGVCMFISMLSLVGFPCTIGSFSEEYVIDHLTSLGSFFFLIPLTFSILTWVSFRRFCDTFYGRCTVNNIKLFQLKTHEKISLNILTILNIAITIIATRGF